VTRLARVICVCTGVGCAVWLIPASIRIVDWPSNGPVRVAMLAPLWQLWLTLAIAFATAIALDRTAGRNGWAATDADTLSPLALMWLWAIPYLPWLPDRAPALLVLAGPLRWAVLSVAVFGCLWVYCARSTWWPRIRLPGRRAVCAASLAFYVGFGLWSAETVGPGADEPHYLVITQSLLRDHDLAIENNHTRGDYREYFGGELRPDFLRRGLNEVIYSIHAPGLPALLVPAFAIGGYRAAVVMLCLFGALAAVAVFDLALLLAGQAAAWATWASVCLTVPFVPHAWLIFPEMPGALLMAWAALWLYAPLPARTTTWVWRGAALGMLPWLHTKFVILLAAMVGALAIRIWRDRRRVAALVASAIGSAALWIYSFYLLYGVFDPQIPYGDFPKLYVLLANIPRGVLGLLFDQKFGLLVYAPVYAIAIAGCWMMLRQTRQRWFALALLATVVTFVASSTRMYMWWGGSSAPARFLVPIVPLLGPMIAVAWNGFRSPAARTIAALLLIASVSVAVTGVVSPQRFMLFSAPHGLANLVVAAQGPSPLSYLLPTFTEGDVRAPLMMLLPWAAAVVAAAITAIAVARVSQPGAGFAAAAAGLTAFVLSGAVLAGAPAPESERRATVLRGRVDLMQAYDGSALKAFDYGRRTWMREPQLLAATALALSRAAGELSSDPARFAGPFDLPAGRFAARIVFDKVAARDPATAVAVLIGNGAVLARVGAASADRIEFDVPIEASVRLTASDAALASMPQSVEIVAESIVPRAARPRIEPRAIEGIDDRPGALIIYADDDTYPEGGVFWTRETRTAKVFVASGGAATLVTTLHVGPTAGRVRLIVDGEDRSVDMAADQTMRVDVPLSTTKRLVPVVVESPGRFRPSDHDPHSTDRRWLGCQVRLELR
jgi:hypothetical protein